LVFSQGFFAEISPPGIGPRIKLIGNMQSSGVFFNTEMTLHGIYHFHYIEEHGGTFLGRFTFAAVRVTLNNF
jgi:hypothetical protein